MLIGNRGLGMCFERSFICCFGYKREGRGGVGGRIIGWGGGG